MKTRYICQLLRISSFDHYGNAVFDINVPINAYLFDKFDDACEFGNKNICKADVRRGYWGKEYNYEDGVEIICGYIIYETNNQNYCTYNDLPSDRKMCRERFCNATFLADLQSAYEDGGQRAMYKYAKQKYGCYR